MGTISSDPGLHDVNIGSKNFGYNYFAKRDSVRFIDNLKITNNHSFPGALQSPWISLEQGMHPHRSVKIGAPYGERPEAYEIEANSSSFTMRAPSPAGAAAIGSMRIGGNPSNGQVFGLTGSNSLEVEFIFSHDVDTADGTTSSDRVLVGIAGVLGDNTSICDRIVSSVAGSNLHIVANKVESNLVEFTQVTRSSSGNTDIFVAGNSLNVTASNFIGGRNMVPHSKFRLGLAGSRFYRISNKKVTTGSSPLGNYSQDYQIVQTHGRLINNRFLVENEGEGLSGAEQDSFHVSGVVD